MMFYEMQIKNLQGFMIISGRACAKSAVSKPAESETINIVIYRATLRQSFLFTTVQRKSALCDVCQQSGRA